MPKLLLRIVAVLLASSLAGGPAVTRNPWPAVRGSIDGSPVTDHVLFTSQAAAPPALPYPSAPPSEASAVNRRLAGRPLNSDALAEKTDASPTMVRLQRWLSEHDRIEWGSDRRFEGLLKLSQFNGWWKLELFPAVDEPMFNPLQHNGGGETPSEGALGELVLETYRLEGMPIFLIHDIQPGSQYRKVIRKTKESDGLDLWRKVLVEQVAEWASRDGQRVFASGPEIMAVTYSLPPYSVWKNYIEPFSDSNWILNKSIHIKAFQQNVMTGPYHEYLPHDSIKLFDEVVQSGRSIERPSAAPAGRRDSRGPLALIRWTAEGQMFEEIWKVYMNSVKAGVPAENLNYIRERMLREVLTKSVPNNEMTYFRAPLRAVMQGLKSQRYQPTPESVERVFREIRQESQAFLSNAFMKFMLAHRDVFVFSPGFWKTLKRWLHLEFRTDPTRHPEDWKWVDASTHKGQKALRYLRAAAQEWFRQGVNRLEEVLKEKAVRKGTDNSVNIRYVYRGLYRYIRDFHADYLLHQLLGEWSFKNDSRGRRHGQSTAV
jgi:hypothetical protein